MNEHLTRCQQLMNEISKLRNDGLRGEIGPKRTELIELLKPISDMHIVTLHQRERR